MTRGRVYRGALALIGAATMVAAVGCSSGAAGQNAGGGNSLAPVQDKSDATNAVTDYLGYVKGKAGAADPALSPISIGWVNQQGGTQDSPEATNAAQAAVKYVNAELGGIGGHPLSLTTCFIVQAEEEGQKCGQRLLNDQGVSVVAFGLVATGNQSFQAVLDGRKPIVIGVSGAPSDATAKNTYVLYGDQTHVLTPWGTFVRDKLKAKSAAVVYASQAGANTAAAAAVKGLQDAGIQAKSVGYDPQATDLIGPLTAAGAQTAEVIVPMTDPTGCVNVAKALTQIASTKPVVSNPLCLAPQVSQGLGDIPNGWVFGIAQTLPSDTTAPDTKVYVDLSTKYGVAKAATANPYSALGWDLVLTIARLMNEAGAGNITPDTMTERLKAFTGPLVMGAPTVKCGKYPDAAAVCNDQTKFYQYEGKGSFKAVSDWLTPPK